MALIFTLIRRGRSANMIPATAFGAILAGLAAWPLAAPSSPDPFQFQMNALNSMLVQPLAFMALTLGPTDTARAGGQPTDADGDSAGADVGLAGACGAQPASPWIRFGKVII